LISWFWSQIKKFFYKSQHGVCLKCDSFIQNKNLIHWLKIKTFVFIIILNNTALCLKRNLIQMCLDMLFRYLEMQLKLELVLHSTFKTYFKTYYLFFVEQSFLSGKTDFYLLMKSKFCLLYIFNMGKKHGNSKQFNCMGKIIKVCCMLAFVL